MSGDRGWQQLIAEARAPGGGGRVPAAFTNAMGISSTVGKLADSERQSRRRNYDLARIAGSPAPRLSRTERG
jgi:hypothetical protein